jgi:DNA-binding Lrp family transcriptional regulator
MLTGIEKKVISLVQGDIPVSKRPYRELAQRIGLTEETFLEILSSLNARGIVRRFGATLRHQKSGFAANAMGAWKVAEERIEEVGRKWPLFGRFPTATAENLLRIGPITCTP